MQSLVSVKFRKKKNSTVAETETKEKKIQPIYIFIKNCSTRNNRYIYLLKTTVQETSMSQISLERNLTYSINRNGKKKKSVNEHNQIRERKKKIFVTNRSR